MSGCRLERRGAAVALICIAALASVAPACRPAAGSGEGRAVPEPVAGGPGALRVRGTVRVTGTREAPSVTLVDSAGKQRVLTGPRSRELARVARAEVLVEGEAPSPAAALEVERYTIESIDGRRPVVGTLLARGSGLALAGTDTLELVGAGEELHGHAGATMWATGTRDGPRLAVAAYGILRDP